MTVGPSVHLHMSQCPCVASDAARGGTYRLVVRGEFGDRFAPHFEGMQIESRERTTIMTGRVIDQAQLLGLIDRISELGMQLVSVEPVDEAHDVRE